MQVEIKHLEAKNVAAFRLVGPWQETAPQGFARLSEWVERHQLAGDWLAIYYDNPRSSHREVTYRYRYQCA